MKRKKKIIVHNLTFKGIEVVPGVLDFDQRGIVYANPHDIVITKNKPDFEYLAYLEYLGWDFKNTIFLSSNVVGNYLHNTIFKDPTITTFITNLNDYYLDTYNATHEEHRFSTKINKEIYTNARVALKYGTKSGFRKLVRKLGFPIAQGYENITTVEQALESIKKLHEKGALEIAIKVDEGISGAGITKILVKNFFSKKEKEQKEIIQKALFKLQQAGKGSGATVEEWVSGVVASPSLQFEIYPGGKMQLISTHDQLLEGKEQWYMGCVYPAVTISKPIENKVMKQARQIAHYLAQEGYYGFFGLDLIVTSDNNFYWVEANMRKTGTTYPRIIAERLHNNSLKEVHYVARDFTIPALKGMKFSEVLHVLKELLYPINSEKRGIVLYNTGALKDGGRFDVVCFGRDMQDAMKIYEKLKNKLVKIGGNR